MTWNRGRYYISSWSQYHIEEQPRFYLAIRINGRRFGIMLQSSNFENSPSRLQEFYLHTRSLQHEDEESDNDGDSGISVQDDPPWTDPELVNNCFDWVVGPFLESFESLAPPPANDASLTLADIFHDDAFDCYLKAVDDQLVAGPIEKLESKAQELRIPGLDEGYEPMVPWVSPFRPFRLRDVEVICDERERTENLQSFTPNKVKVNGEILTFKSLYEPKISSARREIETHEKIGRARFGPEVHTSHLYGVVLDEAQQPFGLLFDHIAKEVPLAHLGAWNGGKPESTRRRWARQVETTVKALHDAGIVWGNATPRNVLLDENENAWIVNFGDMWWGDDTERGTVEGDLRGLEEILQAIEDLWDE